MYFLLLQEVQPFKLDFYKLLVTYSGQNIFMDNKMNDKLIYVPNDNKHYNPFRCLVEKCGYCNQSRFYENLTEILNQFREHGLLIIWVLV